MEQQLVSGIAYSRDEAKITLVRVPDKPGVAAAIFGPLADGGINVDMIVQNTSEDGKFTDMTFTVGRAEFERAIMLERQREGIAKAKAEGKYKGRKPTAMNQKDEIKRLNAGGMGATEIATKLGIGRASVYRALAETAKE